MKILKKLILLIILFISACSNEHSFPNTDVYIVIPVTMPQYTNLSVVWGYEYLTGGLGGIIVVRGLDNNFIAYDRSCTFELNAKCIISGESTNNPLLNCEKCCNSQFSVYDGSVTGGPANQALKRYNTYFDGEMLYITN